MYEYIDGCTNGWIDGWLVRCIDGCMNIHIDEWFLDE